MSFCCLHPVSVQPIYNCVTVQQGTVITAKVQVVAIKQFVSYACVMNFQLHAWPTGEYAERH